MAKADFESVKMDDGRIVEFPGKRKLLKESFIGDGGQISVRLDFRNGETRTFACPETLVAKAAAHGLEQKLGDEMAGIESLEDAIQAIDELMERLKDGPEGWKTQREGPSALAGASALAKALVEVTGKTIEEVRGYLSKLTPAMKIALRQNPEVAPVLARIEADKKSKAPSIDTDSLLLELRA